MNGCVYRTADNQCEKFSDPVRNTLSWCVGDTPCEARKLSNADCIRSMTDEELAEWLKTIVQSMSLPIAFVGFDKKEMVEDWLAWLKKEVDDEL